MRPKALTVSVLILLMVLSASAHDLFLKLDSYFLPPNAKAKVQQLNGTFQSSDGIVRCDRMGDISLIALRLLLYVEAGQPTDFRLAFRLWRRLGVSM